MGAPNATPPAPVDFKRVASSVTYDLSGIRITEPSEEFDRIRLAIHDALNREVERQGYTNYVPVAFATVALRAMLETAVS